MHNLQVTMNFNSTEELAAFFSNRSAPSFSLILGGLAASDACGTTPAATSEESAAPASTTNGAVAGEDVPSKFDSLMAELNDSRYTLRSVGELLAKTGIESASDLYRTLTDNGVGYVSKTRRSDRAALVGLSSRN